MNLQCILGACALLGAVACGGVGDTSAGSAEALANAQAANPNAPGGAADPNNSTPGNSQGQGNSAGQGNPDPGNNGGQGGACGTPALASDDAKGALQCQAQGDLKISLRGDLGDTATVTVQGPNGFTATAPATRHGGSCQYQAEIKDPGLTSGAYTITVKGTKTATLAADVTCS
jgi:hypothetical protein